MVFNEITDLNYEAQKWCDQQKNKYHRSVDCVPDRKHEDFCMLTAEELRDDPALYIYLAPERKISFDGFVNYEAEGLLFPIYTLRKHAVS